MPNEKVKEALNWNKLSQTMMMGQRSRNNSGTCTSLQMLIKRVVELFVFQTLYPNATLREGIWSIARTYLVLFLWENNLYWGVGVVYEVSR